MWRGCALIVDQTSGLILRLVLTYVLRACIRTHRITGRSNHSTEHTMGMQMRPQGGDPRFYAPNRDIAYCFTHIVSVALAALDDEEKRPPWIADYMEHTGTTQDDLCAAAKAMADGIANFVDVDKPPETPHESLDQSGFLDSPPAAQLILSARIGQVLTGLFFTAVRDITPAGSRSPVSDDMATMVAEAARLTDDIESTKVDRAAGSS